MIALIITVLLLVNLPAFQINAVAVEGIQRIPQGDIAAVLHTTASSVFTLDRGKAIKAISASFPELENVQIHTSLKRGVVVQAVERQPILTWKSGDQSLWIDQDGIVMPVRGEAANLVTIQSSVTPPLTNPIDTTQGVLDYARLALTNQMASTSDEIIIPQMDPNVLKAAIELTSKLPQGASPGVRSHRWNGLDRSQGLESLLRHQSGRPADQGSRISDHCGQIIPGRYHPCDDQC